MGLMLVGGQAKIRVVLITMRQSVIRFLPTFGSGQATKRAWPIRTRPIMEWKLMTILWRDLGKGVHHRIDHCGLLCLIEFRWRSRVVARIGGVQDERHDNAGVVLRGGIRRPVVAVACGGTLPTLLAELDVVDGHIF